MKNCAGTKHLSGEIIAGNHNKIQQFIAFSKWEITTEPCALVNANKKIIDQLTTEPCELVNANKKIIDQLTTEPCELVNANKKIIDQLTILNNLPAEAE